MGEVRLAVEEIMKMKSFSHPNVLTLTGVSFDHHFSPCIVMPFMENGSLDKYLQKQKHTLNLWFPTDEPTVETKVVSSMLYIKTYPSSSTEIEVTNESNSRI